MYLTVILVFAGIYNPSYGYEEDKDINIDNMYNIAVNQRNNISLRRFNEYRYNLNHLHHLEHMERDISFKNDEPVDISTTTVIIETITRQTLKPNTNAGNVTVEEIKFQKLMRDLDEVLAKNGSRIPNFLKGDDDAETITRRFDSLPTNIKPKTRREYYFDKWEGKNVLRRKEKVIELMRQFIYATRYKLPYAQLQRKKYSNIIKYKIGFCFALLRNLKREQKLLYATLEQMKFRISHIYTHMKFYEKILRLSVDMDDVMRYIKRLERARKLEIDPTHYDIDTE